MPLFKEDWIKVPYVACFLPTLLNPELRLFPNLIVNPYAGYSFDLMSAWKENPCFSLRTGLLVDAGWVRLRAGYEKPLFAEDRPGGIGLGVGLLVVNGLGDLMH